MVRIRRGAWKGRSSRNFVESGFSEVRSASILRMLLIARLPTTIDHLRAVFLLTGNMASGKSTVAQLLAERLPRAAHVRGDAFRRMIVTGRPSLA